MRRYTKTKKGFTLVEMVLVIAIILILASVVAISVSDILKNSKAAATSVDVATGTMKDGIAEQEDLLKSQGFGGGVYKTVT